MILLKIQLQSNVRLTIHTKHYHKRFTKQSLEIFLFLSTYMYTFKLLETQDPPIYFVNLNSIGIAVFTHL